jgi:hypothetical protein
VKYEYTIDSLRLDEIYPSVSFFGNLYAGYLFDFLMNDYIARNLQAGYQPSGYYTYDRLTGDHQENQWPEVDQIEIRNRGIRLQINLLSVCRP